MVVNTAGADGWKSGALMNDGVRVITASVSQATAIGSAAILRGISWAYTSSFGTLSLSNSNTGASIASFNNFGESGAAMGLNYYCPNGIYYSTGAGTAPDFTIWYERVV